MAEEKKTSKKADAEKTEKAAKKKSKKNPFKSIASFFKSVKSEGKKVTWASGKDVLKNTIVVLIVCVIAGVAIFAVDTVLTQGMGALKKAAVNESTTVSETVADDEDEDKVVEPEADDAKKSTDDTSKKDAE